MGQKCLVRCMRKLRKALRESSFGSEVLWPHSFVGLPERRYSETVFPWTALITLGWFTSACSPSNGSERSSVSSRRLIHQTEVDKIVGCRTHVRDLRSKAPPSPELALGYEKKIWDFNKSGMRIIRNSSGKLDANDSVSTGRFLLTARTIF